MTDSIRILIADDHKVVRRALRVLLEQKPDFTVIGEAADGEEAIQDFFTLRPDILLLDLEMPNKNGIEVIKSIKAQAHDARILVLTSYVESDKIFESVQAGASGYFNKNASTIGLMDGIRRIYQGQFVMQPELADRVLNLTLNPPDLPLTESPLTNREMETLKLVAQGLSNREIGLKLQIQPRTVATHVGNILDKLHLANRTQAALYALRRGYAELSEDDG